VRFPPFQLGGRNPWGAANRHNNLGAYLLYAPFFLNVGCLSFPFPLVRYRCCAPFIMSFAKCTHTPSWVRPGTLYFKIHSSVGRTRGKYWRVDYCPSNVFFRVRPGRISRWSAMPPGSTANQRGADLSASKKWETIYG
jgi:hypothetical protein